jgi:hypothetical protein
MVEVMFAARASMPVSIKAGKVMKVPPPANAFWIPAHKETAKSIISSSMCPPSDGMLTAYSRAFNKLFS